MNIDSIRMALIEQVGIPHTFQYIGSRGMREKFQGVITKVYPRTFLIETMGGGVRSFSYSDYLLHALKIVV